MDLLETLRENLPEGRTHLFGKLEKKYLAAWVEKLFIRGPLEGWHLKLMRPEMETLIKIEVAYQVIQFLLEDEDEYVPGVIQNEDDWRWFFQLGTEEELQEILERKKKRQEDMLESHKLEEGGNI